jgi:ERO1-like protein alpha
LALTFQEGGLHGSPRRAGGTASELAVPDGAARLVMTPGISPNVDVYVERLGRHPERLSNLAFTYLFVARAVAKAQPALQALDLNTGEVGEDEKTRQLLSQLTRETEALGGFDETSMFRVEELAAPQPSASCPGVDPSSHPAKELASLQARHTRSAELLSAYRSRYRNISQILDCVGCEKCKLWGKLQFLGLGTSMKVLFAEAEGQLSGQATALHLSRNEAVALINVFHRLSISFAAIRVMRDLEAQRHQQTALGAALQVTPGACTFLFIALIASWVLQQRAHRERRKVRALLAQEKRGSDSAQSEHEPEAEHEPEPLRGRTRYRGARRAE